MKKLILIVCLLIILLCSQSSGIVLIGSGGLTGGDVVGVSPSSAAIDGDALTVIWDSVCSQGGGYNDSYFDLDGLTAGDNIGITYQSGSGTDTWVFTAASAAIYGDTVNLDYDYHANVIEDASYNDLGAFSNQAVTNNTAEASTLDWTDCVFFMSFEAGDTTGDYDISTSNGDYSAGDTTMAYNESASLESTSPIVGSYSGSIDGYGWFTLAVSAGDLGPGSSGAIGMWINVATWAATPLIMYGGGDDIFNIQALGADEFRWAEYDQVEYYYYESSDANIGTSTNYFVEFIWSAGVLSMYVNNVAVTVSDPGNWTSWTGFTSLTFGDPEAGGATYVFDNLMIFDSVANLTDGRLWGYRNAAYND